MIQIDASEGGGQLVRTALALSAISGEPFRIEGIRASRPNPGLAAQHLAAIEVLAAITDAEVSGAEPGASSMSFDPDGIEPGTYEADIGTAGSVTLLFDAVLPLATAVDGHLMVTCEGGTDVEWSPTIDWYRQVKLPLLRRHGIASVVDVDRRGFYPDGGGSATLWVAPSEPRPIDLVERGELHGARAYSVASADLADREVAERQAEAAAGNLAAMEVDLIERVVSYVDSPSTGSSLCVRLDWRGSRSGVDALGERGKPAEEVAGDATDAVREALDSPAAVDRYLADQLAVFVALAGGRVSIPEATDHVESTIDLLDRFDRSVAVDGCGPTPTFSG